MSDDIIDRPARARVEAKELKLPSDAIARQKYQDMVAMISAPEIFIPRRDYVQKDDLDIDKMSTNLSLFMMQESKQAQKIWVEWIESLEVDDLASLFFTSEELEEFKTYTTLVKEIEDQENSRERTDQFLVISSTPKFTEAKITDLAPSTSGRSIVELDQFADKRTLEMVGRNLDSFASDWAFMDPSQDPDFMNPLSLSNKSRGGFLILPASRPYDLTFSIKITDKGNEKSYISRPKKKSKDQKDYTTEQDLKYLLRSRGCSNFTVECITPEDSIKWEYDLRFTPSVNEKFQPDPVNYIKIDNDSPVGRRLIISLKENPYHEWEESSWEWIDNGAATKKVVLSRKVHNGVYWVYVSDRDISKKKFGRKRVIWPQVTEVWDQTYKTGARYIVAYKIRSSDPSEAEKPFNRLLESKLIEKITEIKNLGYVFASKSSHDDFGAIVYSFVRNDLLTAKQRFIERSAD